MGRLYFVKQEMERTMLREKIDIMKASELLELMGMKSSNGMRDHAFYEASGIMTDEVCIRIEEVMGGPVPVDVKSLIYLVIESASVMSGPELSITNEGAEVPEDINPSM